MNKTILDLALTGDREAFWKAVQTQETATRMEKGVKVATAPPSPPTPPSGSSEPHPPFDDSPAWWKNHGQEHGHKYAYTDEDDEHDRQRKSEFYGIPYKAPLSAKGRQTAREARLKENPHEPGSDLHEFHSDLKKMSPLITKFSGVHKNDTFDTGGLRSGYVVHDYKADPEGYGSSVKHVKTLPAELKGKEPHFHHHTAGGLEVSTVPDGLRKNYGLRLSDDDNGTRGW